jgi:hypothetical protein
VTASNLEYSFENVLAKSSSTKLSISSNAQDLDFDFMHLCSELYEIQTPEFDAAGTGRYAYYNAVVTFKIDRIQNFVKIKVYFVENEKEAENGESKNLILGAKEINQADMFFQMRLKMFDINETINYTTSDVFYHKGFHSKVIVKSKIMPIVVITLYSYTTAVHHFVGVDTSGGLLQKMIYQPSQIKRIESFPNNRRKIYNVVHMTYSKLDRFIAEIGVIYSLRNAVYIEDISTVTLPSKVVAIDSVLLELG